MGFIFYNYVWSLVKGARCKDGYELLNVYGENLCTIRKGIISYTVIPVYIKNDNKFYIMDGVGQFPMLKELQEYNLVMPESSWKNIDLSLTPIEKLHNILDIVGFIPVIGTVADVANATVYAVEKEYLKMGLYMGFAAFSIIPIISKTSKKVGIKLTNKEGAEKLVANAKKKTLAEYEKVCVEVTSFEKVKVVEKEIKVAIELPKNDSQLKHIFREEEGHLANTLENQRLLRDLANDINYYKGRDKYGNDWNIKITDDKQQLWVRYRNSVINEGGLNKEIRAWDSDTGLNRNPFKK